MNTTNGNGGKLSYRPDNMLKLKLSKSFSDTLNASIFSNYIGKSVNGTDKVASYSLYDFAINKKLNHNTRLQFAIDNLTDEKLDKKTDNHMTELVGREYRLNLTFDF